MTHQPSSRPSQPTPTITPATRAPHQPRDHRSEQLTNATQDQQLQCIPTHHDPTGQRTADKPDSKC